MAEMVVRFDTEKQVVFDEAWSTRIGSSTTEVPRQDWQALRARFEPFAQSPDLRRAAPGINLMIGELSASHPASCPADGWQPAGSRVGDLGAPDRQAYEAGRALVRRSSLGPAAIEGTIKPGDVLTAVDGKRLAPGPTSTPDADRASSARCLPSPQAARRAAVVRPVPRGRRPQPTAPGSTTSAPWKSSGGRLGYVHILT